MGVSAIRLPLENQVHNTKVANSLVTIPAGAGVGQV